jgi:hypothetical protein
MMDREWNEKYGGPRVVKRNGAGLAATTLYASGASITSGGFRQDPSHDWLQRCLAQIHYHRLLLDRLRGEERSLDAELHGYGARDRWPQPSHIDWLWDHIDLVPDREAILAQLRQRIREHEAKLAEKQAERGPVRFGV